MLQAKLEFRQTQSLVITPQLQQAIKLLQLSNLDLLNYLEREIEQNPLLEWEDKNAEPAIDGDGSAPEPEIADERAHSGELTDNGFREAAEPFEHAPSPSGANDRDDASEASEYGPSANFETLSLRSGNNGSVNGDYARAEDFTAAQITLRDHLRQQLHIAIVDHTQRLIGEYLIDLIDDAGYLREPLDNVSERLSVEVCAVEDVLRAIQKFEPVGVGARTLAECLAIQLKELDRFDPAMAKLIGRLDLLADHDFMALRRICEVDQDDLADMIAEVRALNPRPGLDVGFSAASSVIPDILVDRDRSGGWNVQLNGDTLPKICVNQSYYYAAKRLVRSEKDKSYLRTCMTTANWLARSLDQRRRTMVKVAFEIVRQQEAFLEHGVRGLRPLALKDVAERIGMHESTVSRVTSNKYMQTPRGTFELKYFFTSAIQARGNGDAHSSESVKHRIKELIDNESPSQILSDDKIVTILQNEGIDIARRTVAKYRESMRIFSSTQRRRMKKASSDTFSQAGR